MPLSPTEAADALRDISQTEQHSSTLRGYEKASPYLILWGFIWLIGYSLSYVRPQWGIAWAVLSAIGVIASFVIGMRSRSEGNRAGSWRFGATFLAIFFFIAALFAIMPPRDPMQVGAFFPILVALFYSLVGIWSYGQRMLITGVIIAVLTLIGFFYLPAYFTLWMAVVGGGGLILGGIWLRSV
jgi:hypothetical protein